MQVIDEIPATLDLDLEIEIDEDTEVTPIEAALTRNHNEITVTD